MNVATAKGGIGRVAPRFRAAVFDLDGTLLDTLQDLACTMNHVLAANGFEMRTIEQVRHDVGNGNVRFMERSLPLGGATSGFDGLMDQFRGYYADHMLDHTLPYPGIPETLAALSGRGVALAIASNKFDWSVKELAERFFPGVIHVACGEDEAHGYARKPAPDLVFRALGELGCDVGDAVYVGDSEVDIQTAANAGMPCVSVSWGFRTRDQLDAAGASVIVDEPSQLLAAICG